MTKFMYLMRMTSKGLGVRVADICSERRDRSIVIARQMVMTLAHEELGMSFPEIGAKMNRHHSTVLYAVTAHAKRMDKNPNVAYHHSQIRDIIANNEVADLPAINAPRARRAYRKLWRARRFSCSGTEAA